MPLALWTALALGAMVSSSKEGSLDLLSCDPVGICDGSSRSFQSIPSGLVGTIKSLDLSNNEITSIGHSDLQRCVQLRALRLTSNRIHTIDKDSFSSLSSLEHLDLASNLLSNLSAAWFRPLSSLKFLNLLGNPYRTLGETPLFSPLACLRILRIGNPNTFMKIQRKDFAGLSFLEELEVDASNLQGYEPEGLRSIQNITHLILNMRRPTLLLDIFPDLLSSVGHLELRETDLNYFHFSGLTVTKSNPRITKFTFRNVKITDESGNEVLKLLTYITGLLELEFDDCTLNGIGDFQVVDKDTIQDLGKVETLTIRNLHIPKFYLFYDMSTIYSLTERLKRVTVENSKVFLVPCSFSQHLRSLEYLDLGENLMVEEYLQNSACENAWPSLHTLILRQNHLTSLERTGEILLTLRNLTDLDVSRNGFHAMPDSCQWPEKLARLNLSTTRIDSLTSCIPQTLQVLDVSNNNLNSFSLTLPKLQELYICRNMLKTLPGAASLPMLLVLKVSRNTINTFSKEEVEAFQQLKTLEAGGNNFICSCEFLSFMQEQKALAKVLTDWPEGYLCDSPSHVRGQRVQDVHLSVTECHKAAVVSGVCCALILLMLLTGVLCHRLHGLWYLKMMWAWLQAKRKPKKAPSRDICYDAFVSYSEQDSYWVENLLVQELENFNPPFRLCLHKRDFVPGKWIIDNIIDSIEKSHKTVFVLSENFVQSEWCKYELDFSHFRLFDENNDAAILILLEPIEKKAIPQRFCKLRKIMNTRTYLEWPSEEDQHAMFWVNLRAAIRS
ncbi:toll-like receptor 2 isoform X2 [Ochotona princeps]|nr:toll-like receptor 2 isoform X2 [Ochotona princeps]